MTDTLNSAVFKIRNSIDLFLTDDTLLTAYYINTRQRKNFHVNKEIKILLELIDGIKNLNEIKKIMLTQHNVSETSVSKTINLLLKNINWSSN